MTISRDFHHYSTQKIDDKNSSGLLTFNTRLILESSDSSGYVAFYQPDTLQTGTNDGPNVTVPFIFIDISYEISYEAVKPFSGLFYTTIPSIVQTVVTDFFDPV